MAKPEELNYTPSHNIIAGGTLIKGEITTEGDFRIDGTIDGTITSKGKIIIGDKGKFIGKIKAANVDIMGVVKGEIFVDNTLSLKSTGKIEGDIQTNILIIEQNAEFNGSCSMSKEPQKVQNQVNTTTKPDMINITKPEKK